MKRITGNLRAVTRLAALTLVLAGGQLLAAQSSITSESSSAGWNLVLLALVIATAAGSAVLPLSALRHWNGYWKLVAALPLLLLVLWVIWIVVAKLLVPGSHAYWLLEVFAWAMLTMIYMATVMIARRQFQKADNPEL